MSMSAQEALEKFGYILHRSNGGRKFKPGDVVENMIEDAVVPIGQKLNVISECDEAEAISWMENVGWMWDYKPNCTYFRVTAE